MALSAIDDFWSPKGLSMTSNGFFFRSIKTVSKTDFYIQTRNDSRKSWKVNTAKAIVYRNYFSDFLYAVPLFRRINAKVIQAEVLIYLSFWFDLYIIKILLVQDMAMKSKYRWSWHRTILFCVWYRLMVEEGTLIAVWSTQSIPAQSSPRSIVSVSPIFI